MTSGGDIIAVILGIIIAIIIICAIVGWSFGLAYEDYDWGYED